MEPGGELYPLNTPLRDLGDFGLGVGLYFSSRIAMVLVFAIIGMRFISSIPELSELLSLLEGFLNVFTIMGN